MGCDALNCCWEEQEGNQVEFQIPNVHYSNPHKNVDVYYRKANVTNFDEEVEADEWSWSWNIKDKLSSIACADNGVAICNIFISGQNFLSKEDYLIQTLKSSEMILSSHSKWNDKMLIRIVSKDAYEFKLIKKKLLL